jgi:hypothetical protein
MPGELPHVAQQAAGLDDLTGRFRDEGAPARVEAAPVENRGADIPPPVLVLEMKNGRVLRPARNDVRALRATPEWAKPILAAAFRCHEVQTPPSAKAAARE